ncbi:MAG: hypothetical protein JSW00_07090 [Thermoplasmata archaeon]|nr:MAG: hypothetical protein JSW00_07090 [Thermoplasmata archaeon]
MAAISRIWDPIFVRYLTDLVYRSSHAFGNEIKVYLTDLGNGFRVLSHGFGIPNVRDGGVNLHGGLWDAGCETFFTPKMGIIS